MNMLSITHRASQAGILLGAALALLAPASLASAQGPDIRSIPPVVMLLVDSSGSMEKIGDCACATPTCEECLPNCAAADPARSRWATVVEALTGEILDYGCSSQTRSSADFVGEPDYRYFLPHIALEGRACASDAECPAGYTCSPLEVCQADDGILDTYRDRVKFGLMTFDSVNSISTLGPLTSQPAWDAAGIGTCDDNGCLNGSSEGGYSYGGRQAFVFQGCDNPYYLDNGARNSGDYDFDGTLEVEIPGRLVSVGQTVIVDSEESTADFDAINSNIQAALTDPAMRPYGATPIAGMLSDLEYYFENHPHVRGSSVGLDGDPFRNCRDRYAILLTDGRPNLDMREAPYYCGTASDEADLYGLAEPCPYRTSVDQAELLVSTEQVRGVYVVGFTVSGDNCASLPLGPDRTSCEAEAAAAVAELDDIAFSGNTDEAIFVGASRAELQAALAQILDEASPGTTTRTVPAVSNVSAGGVGPQVQLRFKTGFQVGSRADEESTIWTGTLDLETIECSGDPADPYTRRLIGEGEAPITPAEYPEYRFHVRLNCTGAANGEGNCEPGTGAGTPNTTPQTLYTVDLSGATDQTMPAGSLAGQGASEVTARGLPIPSGTRPPFLDRSLTELSETNALVPPEALGVTDKGPLIDWLDGAVGSEREGNRFGAVVHSSPIVHTAPQRDVPDESFNAFRIRTEIATRPAVAYLGTNDGLLRAFVASPTYDLPAEHPTDPNRTLSRGDQLWAFMPPMVLPDLEQLAIGAERYSVDGTPVIEEIFFAREAEGTIDEDLYHTVLVAGMRAGGNGFFALDVTNPLRPEFLWQVTDSAFGETYGEPGLTHALVDINANIHERGIAILPGGRGELADDNADGTVPDPCDVVITASQTSDVYDGDYRERASGALVTGATVASRVQRRCWEDEGRTLVILDVATGAELRRWGPETFHSPLTGGVAPYPDTTGGIADRAFFTDADGILWRLNMNSPEPTEWEVKAMVDIFHGERWDAAQPSYPVPVVSTVPSGEVVILQGTGELDRFDDPSVENRVLSIMEVIDIDATGDFTANDVSSLINWELELAPGEQVTGRLSLFNGRAYWGSFISTSDPLDACQVGYSRLWGTDYVNRVEGTMAPEPGLTSDETATDPDVQYVHPATGTPLTIAGIEPPGTDNDLDNRLLMGVAVTALPTCFQGSEVSETDPYVPGSRNTFRVTQSQEPVYELTALLSGGSDQGADAEEFTRTLPPPAQSNYVDAYAGVVE